MFAPKPALHAIKAPSSFVSVGLPEQVAQALAGGRTLCKLGLGDVTALRLAEERADVIGCPLMSGAVDALCVIAALEEARFGGTLLVVAPALPDPAMVERELRAATKGFSLRLVTL